MIRILHLAGTYLPYQGGAAVRLHSVLTPLARHPHIETHLLTASLGLGNASELPSYELMDNVHVHRVCSHLQLPSRIRALQRQYQFDVIHAHNARYALLAELLTRCPVILEFHALAHLTGVKAVLTRMACRRAARVFTLASAAANILRDRFGVPAEKLDVLYNGIDADRFDPRRYDRIGERARRGLGKGVVIGYAGTFWEWQGVDLLVKSFATIAADYPTAQLLLVGDGPHAAVIRQLTAEFELQDQVRLTGHVPFAEMPACYACMDVFAITRHATLATDTAVPLKVLEAMSMGACVLATPVGGMREVIEHGVTGWICDNYDPGTIGGALAKLIDDAALHSRLAEAGRLDVVRRFSWQETADKMVRTYESLSGITSATRTGTAGTP